MTRKLITLCYWQEAREGNDSIARLAAEAADCSFATTFVSSEILRRSSIPCHRSNRRRSRFCSDKRHRLRATWKRGRSPIGGATPNGWRMVVGGETLVDGETNIDRSTGSTGASPLLERTRINIECVIKSPAKETKKKHELNTTKKWRQTKISSTAALVSCAFPL